MKKEIRDNSKKQKKEALIEKALRTGGFLFPQTIEEVKEFERIYGTTDIILPPELQEATFLDSNDKGSKKKKSSAQSKNFAMAAREGSDKLPQKIRKQILSDIKLAESKKRKKHN